MLHSWMQEQLASITLRKDLLSEADLTDESRRLLSAVVESSQRGNRSDIDGPEWAPVREVLAEVSASRAQKGFLSSDTAGFVFSLRKPMFDLMQQQFAADPSRLAREVTASSLLLDKLALFTMEVFQKSRETVILRQQEEMLELSTPVVQLYEGILALPLIGTLDSARTQIVMESLLERIVNTGASIAILDITGVPTVDTLVAQHLLKTVAAARLMGADCIISGIRPQIAQTIVHLGVELQNVTTKANLADALLLALRRLGYSIRRAESAKD
ncbi:MAG: STAS domain-containing protein [Bryobacteraceae bacterium]